MKNVGFLVFINEIGNGFADYLIENIDNYNVDFLKSYAFAVPVGWQLNYLNDYKFLDKLH